MYNNQGTCVYVHIVLIRPGINIPALFLKRGWLGSGSALAENKACPLRELVKNVYKR